MTLVGRGRGAHLVVAMAVCSLRPGLVAGQKPCANVTVGSHALHHCVYGEGLPTVVLAAGAASSSGTWDDLVPALAEITRVVTFDRAGFGRSEPGPTARTPTRIAVELGALLRAVDASGPFLLVGHSAGGLHMLRFAERSPESVTAVVLLDTPPPGFEARRMELLTPREQAERRRVLDRGLEGAPEAVSLERHGIQLEASLGFDAYPRAVPLVAVVANGQDFGDLGSQDAHRELWTVMSSAYPALSDTGELLIAEGSGHMIHHERPALVLGLIRRLVEDWRRSAQSRDHAVLLGRSRITPQASPSSSSSGTPRGNPG